MKTSLFSPRLWAGLAALPLATLAQTPAAPGAATPPTAPASSREEGLRFNFRGAPLESVLNYLSEAAGFVIVLETPVRGTIDMWSTQPVSKAEAVQLLNHALNKNGYTATLQGRTLVVASKDEAKKRNIPIRTGNDPREIPANAEMVMQVIPLRHITAAKVATDIATLIPSSATLTANEDSNSLVVTDTNINVRHIVEIVSALDLSVQSDSTLRIFKLENADPSELATLLTSLFPATTTGGGGNNTGPTAFSFPGMPPGMAAAFSARAGGQGGGRNSRNSTSRSGTATPLSAVADPRTQSVIVTASKDMMFQVAEIVAQLDASTARKQKVFVYTLENADVLQVESVLRDLFQVNGARSSSSNQTDPLTNRAASNNQQTGGNFMNNSSGAPR
jgi:type II secretory pathway component GspD/PulD (secretin)